jgi:Ca-activated chloride channel family protein
VRKEVGPLSFVWPLALWCLLLLPVAVAAYGWLLRRRRRHILRVSSLGVFVQARGPAWRRHVPPALVLLALALMLVALARPAARVALPWARSTVILAMDVSLSMRVADVAPTRMVAAQQAARSFLQDLPAHIEVGIVTFAGTAQVAQQITPDRNATLGAIDGIRMQMGTAIGSAIVVSLAELFPDHGIDLGSMLFGPQRQARSLDERPKAAPKVITPVAPGSYDAAAIILLSDGRRTMGVDTLQAAQMAADRGVRIHVIGLGTPDGHLSEGPGMAIYLQLDEPTLREVARKTGGEYHQAATAEALRNIYLGLGSRIQAKARETEVGALLALLSAALLALASGLSVLWFGPVAARQG